MKRFYIRPAPGRRSVDPHTRQPLPAEGAEKPKTNFWMRRVRSKDVIVGQPEPDPNITAELPIMEAPTDG